MNSRGKNQLIIGIVLVVMVSVIAVIFFYQSYQFNKNFFEYNGFTIYEMENNGLNIYQIQFFLEGSEQPFVINSRYSPERLEDIDVYGGLRGDIIKKELYVTMEPTLTGKATIAFAEINKYIENPFLFNLPTFPGLLKEVEDNDLPKVSCEDVSESKAVIMFKIGEKNEVYNENGCVILEATNEDELIRVASRLTLTILGIMNS